MAQNNLIQLSNISQSFMSGDEQIQVLSNVNFTLANNSFTIIFGQSGSGKSTLLNIISGLQQPTTGLASFDGKDLYQLTPAQLSHFRASQIGVVYQTNYWTRSLNVVENVALSMYFMGSSRLAANRKALEALKVVGMEKYEKRMPFLLSGGEQQRIAIARAIVNRPGLLIADEPTGNLDTDNGDKIVTVLQDYMRENNSTVVMVTHNMEYLPLADHLLHIQDGHVKDLQKGDYKVMSRQLIKELKTRIDSLAERQTTNVKPKPKQRSAS
jgi:putative ABC transport system ATP-binding protein